MVRIAYKKGTMPPGLPALGAPAFSQQSTGNAARLYAAVIAAALLGVVLTGLVSFAEVLLRRYARPGHTAGAAR